jgi:type IV secretory pathway TraG/TraD family ATPase VirD4
VLSRALLTPGEVGQVPAEDELVLVSGCPPIRAKKARYYEDRELQARIMPPPEFVGFVRLPGLFADHIDHRALRVLVEHPGEFG